MSSIRSLPAEFPTILAFSGPDAVRFLNGQMTQAVDGLGSTAKTSCITNAKGRMEHYVTICQGPEADVIWVVSDHEPAEQLRARLERYLIADDVEVFDLTGKWQVIHADQALPGAAFWRDRMGPFGVGFDHWWPDGEAPEMDSVDPYTQENLRIEQGIPKWGRELEPGLLPPEAGLDRTSISYHKGCYIGQEVLSRMKTAGKVNRRLAVMELQAEAAAGDPLLLGGKEVGRITSVASSNRLALAYLSKAAFETDRLQTATGSATRVRWA